jgi:hypothetical protein
MRGISRDRAARRRGSRALRTALVGAALTTSILAPGSAAANEDDDPVIPLVTCVTQSQDGRFTAVFGYHNRTNSVVTVRRGDENNVDPTTGTPPEIFQPGVHQGVFSASAPTDMRIEWELFDSEARAYSSTGPSCGQEVQLPADGNGTGTVVALGAAGLFGAAVLYRSRRRIAHAADGAAPTCP